MTNLLVAEKFLSASGCDASCTVICWYKNLMLLLEVYYDLMT
jgi:hypothetical protein